MRMTEDEYKALIKGKSLSVTQTVNDTPAKPSKYHNHKTTITDPKTGELITFDSKKEADYYLELLVRERAGEIKDIERQYKIEVLESFTDKTGKKHRGIYYVADFRYIELIEKSRLVGEERIKKVKSRKRIIHYVDVKGLKTDVYKLKKKLLAYQGIIIEEV